MSHLQIETELNCHPFLGFPSVTYRYEWFRSPLARCTTRYLNCRPLTRAEASRFACGSISTPKQDKICAAGECTPKSQARSAGVILFSEWWSRAAAQPLEPIKNKFEPVKRVTVKLRSSLSRHPFYHSSLLEMTPAARAEGNNGGYAAGKYNLLPAEFHSPASYHARRMAPRSKNYCSPRAHARRNHKPAQRALIFGLHTETKQSINLSGIILARRRKRQHQRRRDEGVPIVLLPE